LYYLFDTFGSKITIIMILIRQVISQHPLFPAFACRLQQHTMNEETLMKTTTEKYDVIIIGSGPGGLGRFGAVEA
jgi:hypothetical protein